MASFLSRALAITVAAIVFVGVFFVLEFVRAHVTEGLPRSVQYVSMGVVALIAGTAAVESYRRNLPRNAKAAREPER